MINYNDEKESNWTNNRSTLERILAYLIRRRQVERTATVHENYHFVEFDSSSGTYFNNWTLPVLRTT